MSFDNDLKVPADMQINDYSICAFIVPVLLAQKVHCQRTWCTSIGVKSQMMGVVGGQNKGNPVFKVSNTVFG